MKKTLLALAAILLSSFGASLFAQSNPVIIEVGGQKIRQTEFMQEFMKSVGDNLVSKPGVTAAEKRQTLEEYVELYANFRTKVLDAQAMGFDTVKELRKELSRYRKELAAPYLIDSAMLLRILHEAYDRNRYALHAAHILVKVAPDASPEDTLEAYNHIKQLRKRIVDGENFFSVAIEEARRLNPKAKVQANEGELSYFSTFNMVYPFESAAYALDIDEVSQPVRTQYGYHLIKLLDRVELYGKVTLQHIWMRNPNSKTAISMAYESLLAGTPFEMVARQSDDHSTIETGGLLPDAALGQLPHEYVKILSGLHEGEISAPFFTRYGWHIVKLIKKDTLPPYESMVPYYKQKMARDQRGDASRKSFAAASRKKYGILDYTTTPVVGKSTKKGKKNQPVEMMASLDEITGLVNDSVFRELWRFSDTAIHDRRPLVHTPSRDYTAVDLAKYIRRNQRTQLPESHSSYVRRQFDNFIDSVSVVYADSQLEKEYPEFADLIADYRRGLMIFDYNDKMIWSKAIYDTVGFSDFYARESKTKRMDNPDDSIYFWNTRARVVTFTVADSLCLEPSKAVKLIAKAQKKNKSSVDMKALLLDKVDGKKCSADEPVTHAVRMVEQGRQNLLAADQWQRGVYVQPAVGKGYSLLVVEDILPPKLKEQMEARGYYLNAWQNEVERNLIKQLRSKYNVKINRDAVSRITF